MVGHGGKKITTSNSNYMEHATDVFANILARVPIKFLLASKCVCKQWHKVIRSPYLIALQLSVSRGNPVYIVYPAAGAVTNVYLVNGDGDVIEMVPLEGFAGKHAVRIICSFNGLLCCVNYPPQKVQGERSWNEYDLEIRICNPATREVLLLPKGTRSYDLPIIGVGFGPGINEYKVFRFFCRLDLESYKCEMFSSITGRWRQIGSVDPHPMNFYRRHHPAHSHHVCVDGKVYWFIKSEESEEYEAIPGSILSMDMDGYFTTVSLPVDVTEHSFLVEFEGTLALVVVFDDEITMQMWSLEDFDLSTWEVKCSVKIPYDTSECAESVVARGRDIFLITTDHYFIYNLDSEIWTEVDFHDEFDSISPVVFTYTESLLSCRGRLDPED